MDQKPLSIEMALSTEGTREWRYELDVSVWEADHVIKVVISSVIRGQERVQVKRALAWNCEMEDE